MADVKKKEQWGSHVDFLLSCIGYAVGLGNITRFPYLCIRNGGGAFLIPYFLFMFIAGIPLFFLEMSLGQYSGKGPIAVFDFCPLFEGLGWGMVMISAMYTLCGSMIVAWILYYLGMSMSSWEPVWGRCDNSWNTPSCLVPGELTTNATVTNFTTYRSDYLLSPEHGNLSSALIKNVSAAEEFYEYNVLELSDDIGDLGGLRWQLVVCYITAWIILFLCMIKGVKSSGKVVYVTATVPYLFLTALLIRGVTLPGSLNGILFYIRPDFQKLLSFKIWAEACLQIFFSLGPAWGGILAMASYNKFHNNVQRDAIIVPLITCFSSFFAGFAIFSVIGYLAHMAGVPVEDAIKSGPGLAFIAYPAALAKIPGPAIWSTLFFLMLLTVLLDSQFVTLETFITALIDRYPEMLRSRRTLITAAYCGVASIIGLIFVSRGGMYWFQIVDWYIAMFSLILIGILEPVVVCYIYGLKNFQSNIKMMIGIQPSMVWSIMWCFLTPGVLMMFFLYLLANQISPYYGNYVYPDWAIGIGWVVAVLPSVAIPVRMIYQLTQHEGNLLQRLKKACAPCSKWQPSDRQNSIDVIPMVNGDVNTNLV